LRAAQERIEFETVVLLAKVIKGGDDQGQAIELSNQSMLNYLERYEMLRNAEKRFISEGYPEGIFTKGRVYGRLIKLLAERSAEADFSRRPSLKETAEKF